MLRVRLANTDITLATALTTSRAGGSSQFHSGERVDFRVIRAYKTNGRDTHDAFVCAVELHLLDAGLPTAEVPYIISSLPEDGAPRVRQLSATEIKNL